MRNSSEGRVGWNEGLEVMVVEYGCLRHRRGCKGLIVKVVE